VFLYSTSGGNSLGGVTGADNTCQIVASEHKLAGTYKAWIADSNPGSAPASRFTQSSVPYVNVLGTKIADNWADLTDGTVDNAISYLANGTAPGTNGVWTNVNTNGTQFSATSTEHCSDWTTSSNGRFGHRGLANSQWTNSGNAACVSSYNVYCFEQ